MVDRFGMRRKDKLVLWSAYFDSDYSWRQGRRVSKTIALRRVKSEEVFQAALELGLNPHLQAEAVHPKHPWIRGGAVLVDKPEPKTHVLKDIAESIQKKRHLK